MPSLKFIHASVVTITTNNLRGKIDFSSHVLTCFTACSFELSLPTVALGIPYHVNTPAAILTSLGPLFTVSFTGISSLL